MKVLFHWDREGKKDLSASCWIRVAQPWAGNGWGAFFWPRAGNEVVVSFEEGDPDQPLIVGSVYNAENMPYFVLPELNVIGGIKSASVRGFAGQNFNGILFHDGKGFEHLAIHSERTLHFNSEWDKEFHAGRNKNESVANVSTGMVGGIPSGGGGGGEWHEELEGRRLDLRPGDPEAARAGPDPDAHHRGEAGRRRGAQRVDRLREPADAQRQPARDRGLGGATPRWAKPFAGAGYGGNLTFTLGANTTISSGRAGIAVTDGDATTLNMRGHLASKIVCRASSGPSSLLWETDLRAAEGPGRPAPPLLRVPGWSSRLLFVLLIIETYYETLSRIRFRPRAAPHLAAPVPPAGAAARGGGGSASKGCRRRARPSSFPIVLGAGLFVDET